MHKVVLEVGTHYLGGKGNFFHFRDPPPLRLDNEVQLFQMHGHVGSTEGKQYRLLKNVILTNHYLYSEELSVWFKDANVHIGWPV